MLPFAAGAALIGFLAGLAARGGLFRRFYLAPVAGFVTGILAGVVSAPIAAFVFGGTAGLGTGAVVSAFRAMGDTLLAAITKQALISDPMDKALVFAIAAAAGLRPAAPHHRPVPLRAALPGARRQGRGNARRLRPTPDANALHPPSADVTDGGRLHRGDHDGGRHLAAVPRGSRRGRRCWPCAPAPDGGCW